MNKYTAHVDFMQMPSDTGANLFAVKAGVDNILALGLADGLDESVRYCLTQAIEGGMPSEIAFICEFAMDVSRQLRASLGAVS